MCPSQRRTDEWYAKLAIVKQPHPIRRRMLAASAALGLVLCLATVGLWVRSYSHLDGFYLVRGDSEFYFLGSKQGRIGYATQVPVTLPTQLQFYTRELSES